MNDELITEYHDLVRSDILPIVPTNAGRVLDFGGGVGATSVTLKNKGAASHIVLLDQVADKALKGVDAAYSIDLNDHQALSSLLDEVGPFDTVLCLDVLEHLIDPWSAVEIIKNHLTAKGVIVVSLPNMSHWSVTIPLVFAGQFRYEDRGIKDRTHLRWFTQEGAKNLLTSSGLRIEKVQSKIWRRSEKLINHLTFQIVERHLTAQYFLVARST